MHERRIVRALESADSVQIDDVIQLDKDHAWGPVLCIVTKVNPWGVECYAFAPIFHDVHAAAARCCRWAPAALRVERGQYERVGRAVWVAQ
jgi:hypothetical protein